MLPVDFGIHNVQVLTVIPGAKQKVGVFEIGVWTRGTYLQSHKTQSSS